MQSPPCPHHINCYILGFIIDLCSDVIYVSPFTIQSSIYPFVAPLCVCVCVGPSIFTQQQRRYILIKKLNLQLRHFILTATWANADKWNRARVNNEVSFFHLSWESCVLWHFTTPPGSNDEGADFCDERIVKKKTKRSQFVWVWLLRGTKPDWCRTTTTSYYCWDSTRDENTSVQDLKKNIVFP